ncbi:MAG TPA: beta-galactosidase [Spirochaetia bacterium]|nr:beta-galactosidase [Spirochaetia bacterium]
MAGRTKNTSSRPISAVDHEFRVGGELTAMYGAAAHYWRLERNLWDAILEKVRGMGFTFISIYIPWEVHETKRGSFDFGEVNPSNDIDAFLTLCEQKGFNIVVRPGPQINSELTWFGYPRRILEDPELQALNGQGTKAVLTQVPCPIPAISYAADKFFEETALWYDAICPILARHAYPKGRLVAAQVDNEMAFFFHVNAYASDFSAASIKRYRAFLKDKYANIAALRKAYRRDWPTFDEVEPPRRFEAETKEAVPYYTDWIAYREHYLIDSMARLADMMRERGLADIALFHNYPHPLGPGGAASGFTTPFNLMGLEEKLDFVGFDVYSRRELYDHMKTIISYMVGTSRFPYHPELIAGVWPWYLNPGDLRDHEFVTKASLMQGIKGFSRYTLVERNRWLDSPVRSDGRVREDHFAMYQKANEMAKKHGFMSFRRQADVLLMANRDYDRLEAASVLVSFPGDFLETPSGFSEYPTFMTVSENTLGFRQPIQMAKSDWFWSSYRALTEIGTAFLLSDTALKPERWKRYKVIVLSSFEYMNSALQHELVDFAKSGGCVILGPIVPCLNDLMDKDETILSALKKADGKPLAAGGKTLGTTYALGKGRLVHISEASDPAEALRAAMEGISVVRFGRNDPRLDVTIHRSESDEKRVIVFIANPTADLIQAEVSLDVDMKSACEVWEGRAVEVRGRVLADAMHPYSIKIFECML